MTMNVVKDYDVNSETMALLPHYDRYANLKTIVLEEYSHFIVPVAPKRIIDESCRYYGASYEGRLEGIKRLMGITKKAPIAISAELGIFFFPLESPKNDTCVWLSHSHIEEIVQNEKRQTQILFTNGQSFTVAASKNQVEIKILRTAQYRHLLQKRTTAQKYSYVLRPADSNHQFVYDSRNNTYRIK